MGDAIDDICDEKRQRLIEEHEASLASPARRDSERDGSENSRSSVHLDEELEQSPPAKERDREKECETEKDAEIEAGRERERAKEKEDRKPLEEALKEEKVREKEREDERVERAGNK